MKEMSSTEVGGLSRSPERSVGKNAAEGGATLLQGQVSKQRGFASSEDGLGRCERLIVAALEMSERDEDPKEVLRQALDEVRKAMAPRKRLAMARRKAAKFVVGACRRLPARREKSFRTIEDDDDAAWETMSSDNEVHVSHHRRSSGASGNNVVGGNTATTTAGTTKQQREASFLVPFSSSSRRKKKKAAKLVVHPNSAFKRRWDFAMSVVAVLFVFGADLRLVMSPLLPVSLAGLWARAALSGVVSFVCNALFFVDMCLNFVTGYVSGDGVLIMSKRRIALHYLCSYFWLDLWCFVPLGTFTAAAAAAVDDHQHKEDFQQIGGSANDPNYAGAAVECARGSTETALSYCTPRRRPLRAFLGFATRRLPRLLAFAKRRGRLRQVVQAAPNLTSAFIHLRGFLRTTKLFYVKWRSIVVVCRRIFRFFNRASRSIESQVYTPLSRVVRFNKQQQQHKKRGLGSLFF